MIGIKLLLITYKFQIHVGLPMKGELHLKIKGPSFMSNHEGWSLRGRDCLVVGFTATYAISAYHHLKL